MEKGKEQIWGRGKQPKVTCCLDRWVLMITSRFEGIKSKVIPQIFENFNSEAKERQRFAGF